MLWFWFMAKQPGSRMIAKLTLSITEISVDPVSEPGTLGFKLVAVACESH